MLLILLGAVAEGVGVDPRSSRADLSAGMAKANGKKLFWFCLSLRVASGFAAKVADAATVALERVAALSDKAAAN
ncbi:hypothetical protein ERJ75_000793500 [Trypanosoma vivax]|nr:hypothetical protein ERJ75_000793500 [Trypanosoma vivax]